MSKRVTGRRVAVAGPVGVTLSEQDGLALHERADLTDVVPVGRGYNTTVGQRRMED
jgi:hypothetical protein